MSRRLGSVLGSRLWRRRSIQYQSSRHMNFRLVGDRPPRIVGYYVVYPEIPEDTAENNAFMGAITKGDWPPFQSASDKEFYDGFIKMALDYGATIFEHNDVLEDQTLEKTFATVVAPFLKEEYNVHYAYSALLQKMTTDWLDVDRKHFKSNLFHAQGTYLRNVNPKFASASLYKALKELYADRANLNPWQRRLIEFYMKELKCHGSDFESTKHLELLSAYRARADEFRSKFHLNISTTHDTKIIRIDQENAHVLKDAPDHVLRALSNNQESPRVGPWTMRMHMTTYG
uniref:Uncharacterized protein n=1 Tax=Plectus sambesii TaxID=2011161 RepID=A0A914UU93_9BILA